MPVSVLTDQIFIKPETPEAFKFNTDIASGLLNQKDGYLN